MNEIKNVVETVFTQKLLMHFTNNYKETANNMYWIKHKIINEKDWDSSLVKHVEQCIFSSNLLICIKIKVTYGVELRGI